MCICSVTFPLVLIISTIILTKSHTLPSSISISSPSPSEKILKAPAFTLKPRNNNSSASDRHPTSLLHHVHHFVGFAFGSRPRMWHSSCCSAKKTPTQLRPFHPQRSRIWHISSNLLLLPTVERIIGETPTRLTRLRSATPPVEPVRNMAPINYRFYE